MWPLDWEEEGHLWHLPVIHTASNSRPHALEGDQELNERKLSGKWEIRQGPASLLSFIPLFNKHDWGLTVFGTADSEVKPGKALSSWVLQTWVAVWGKGQIISMNQTDRKLTSESKKCNQDESRTRGRVCWGGECSRRVWGGHLS